MMIQHEWKTKLYWCVTSGGIHHIWWSFLLLNPTSRETALKMEGASRKVGEHYFTALVGIHSIYEYFFCGNRKTYPTYNLGNTLSWCSEGTTKRIKYIQQSVVYIKYCLISNTEKSKQIPPKNKTCLYFCHWFTQERKMFNLTNIQLIFKQIHNFVFIECFNRSCFTIIKKSSDAW